MSELLLAPPDGAKKNQYLEPNCTTISFLQVFLLDPSLLFLFSNKRSRCYWSIVSKTTSLIPIAIYFLNSEQCGGLCTAFVCLNVCVVSPECITIFGLNVGTCNKIDNDHTAWLSGHSNNQNI